MKRLRILSSVLTLIVDVLLIAIIIRDWNK